MTYEEAILEYQAECAEISAQCVDEGYPSHGSNYELRANEAYKYWMGLVDEEE